MRDQHIDDARRTKGGRKRHDIEAACILFKMATLRSTKSNILTKQNSRMQVREEMKEEGQRKYKRSREIEVHRSPHDTALSSEHPGNGGVGVGEKSGQKGGNIS